MKTENGSPLRQARSVSAKAVYSKKATEKLVDFKVKLDGVRASISNAIATGSLTPSDKLDRAQLAMEARLAMVESRLETLRQSGEEEWEDVRGHLECAWEDLSHVINKLVARIKDESGTRSSRDPE